MLVLEKGELLVILVIIAFMFTIVSFFVANFGHTTKPKQIVTFQSKENFAVPIAGSAG